MRVLVVEDEPKMASLLKRGLERAGLSVDVASDGPDAVLQATATSYDTILLDRMLPGLDGIEVCRHLRDRSVWSPVLMLTAMGEVSDRVEGLDVGADDYLVKPFAFDELLARVRALVRRGPVERPVVLQVGDLCLDPATREVRRRGTAIELTAKEFALLEVFMRHAGQVLTRLALLDHAWNGHEQVRSNVVDAQVKLLREKIDRPFGRESLETVRGVGYRLRTD